MHTGTRDNIAALHALEADCPALLEPLEARLKVFNTFDVLRCSNTEIRHSNVLAWLLDSSENHGFGTRFLREWLSMLLAAPHQQNEGLRDLLSKLEGGGIRVLANREWRGDSNGTLSIDILLEFLSGASVQAVLCIENKVGDKQRDGQLADYRTMVARFYPERCRKFHIFLSRDGEDPADAAFIPTTYSSIARALQVCLEQHPCDDRVKHFLRDYLHVLHNHFMTDSPERKLALDLYRRHRKAFDYIFEVRPDQLTDLTHIVRTGLDENARAAGIVRLRMDKGIIRFVPESWNRPSNRVKDSEDWCHVFCQLELLGKKPNLIATTWAEKSATGQFGVPFQSLSNCAERESFSGRTKNFPKRSCWYSFYRVEFPDIHIHELADQDLDLLGKTIVRRLCDVIQAPDFRTMASSVAAVLAETE